MEFNDTERVILSGYIKEDNLATANRLSAPVTPRRSFYSLYVKRALDIVISLAALIVTLPVNLLIAVVTMFDVGFPIFFQQTRIGKDCRKFMLTKFRNMTNARDENGNLLLPKYRVTRWGRFVRRTSLDELLNFWSILKGDMSIIGPRPLIERYLDRYSDRHKMRHAVRPGLECPYMKDDAPTGNKWQDEFENDVWYVEHVSFATDVKLFFKLIALVFNRKETKSRGEAKRGAFVGYDENGIAMNQTQIPQKYIDRMRAEYGETINAESLEK